ncbi:MAG: HlyD family efflux transporter periplasmic adaptor subunit [Litoreibacter sp.]|nr:HlyD family efflux transporter periplasmic adaptor subunit [Litoreibacter sp.]
MASEAPPEASGPTLSEAMARVFRPALEDETFARALANLAVPLTTAAAAFVFGPDRAQPLAIAPGQPSFPDHLIDWLANLPSDASAAPEPVEEEGAIAIAIALPSGASGLLVIRLRGAAVSVRALAFERLVALSRLSFATYRHADLQALNRLVALIETKPDPDTLASQIRAFTDADLVALAWFEGDRAKRIAISDQPEATRRAALPDALEAQMRDALSASGRPENVFVAGAGNGTFVLRADQARRHPHLLPMLTQTAAATQSMGALNKGQAARKWVRRAALCLVAIGIALIPIPDARRVPGEVISTQARTITAPLSGLVLAVDVADGDLVTSEETRLLQIDTDDIQQELASVQADHARALLERETARGSRDAAALRNAELEAEGLRARIDLLEGQQDRAAVMAPINGVVSGDRLSRFVGATVRQGDPILEVFDPSALALRLEVSDALLNRIEDGEAGIFRPDFAPDQSFDAMVEWISPAQSERSDITVFQGRATLQGETRGALRPGLRGVFIFERSFLPIYQVVWDALRNWVLLRVWL